MLRLLLESNTRGFQFRQGAFVSLVAHSLLISASVLATRDGPDITVEDAQQKVIFLIPMNRTNSPPPREESVRFVREGEKAGNRGFEEKIVDKAATREAQIVGSGKEEGKPEEVAEAVVPNAIYDTVAAGGDGGSARTRHTDPRLADRGRHALLRQRGPDVPAEATRFEGRGRRLRSVRRGHAGVGGYALVPRDQRDAS